MLTNDQKSMDKIVNLCKSRGFVYPGSEIYGGLANSWDYGPLGVELKNNIKRAWWQKFVQESPYNVGLDASIIMNPETWVASGHLGGFSDPLMDCKSCKTRHRADNLIEDFDGTNPAGWTNQQMMDYIREKQIPCPNCGKTDFTDIRQFNLMFKTYQQGRWSRRGAARAVSFSVLSSSLPPSSCPGRRAAARMRVEISLFLSLLYSSSKIVLSFALAR